MTVLLLLLLTVYLNFKVAHLIEESARREKRILLGLVIALDGGILGYFKYFNFFLQAGNDIFRAAIFPELTILLPAGISFYTFQMIACLADVARGRIKAEKDLVLFALFCFYFPQILAGPIERAEKLLPGLKRPSPGTRLFRSGLFLAMQGFLKKVVVADNLAPIANGQLAEADVAATLLGSLFFAGQIYADFSGYTDIARGASRMLGIRLSANFAFPFFATNPAEFWRRWHITLGAFLRDYVYIPLGGNRVSLPLHLRNLLVVWLFTGFWHGASYGFIIWGLYCFGWVSLARIRPVRQFLDNFRLFGMLFTFLTFACGLLLFRQERNLWQWRAPAENLLWQASGAFALCACLLLGDWLLYSRGRKILKRFYSSAGWQGLVLAISVLALLLLGPEEHDRFFYFQF